jgi:cobaltochelatase CobS
MQVQGIKCEICGEETHSIQLHLSTAHPDVSLQTYQERFPKAPIYSEAALERLRAREEVKAPSLVVQHAVPAASPAAHTPNLAVVEKRTLHEVFGLPDSPAVRNGKGDPIYITVLKPPAEFNSYIPEVDPGHVWNVDDLKNMLMAIEMDIPLYVFGHKGCGKTTDLEQICARTGRPLLRVQHTINTEESHILGQWTIQNGQTVFELGPLPLAMRHGFIYLADEYDFGLASVLAVYQPVLEGKSLLIKEAPAADRIVRPNKTNFRFFATGNTNGSGDDTGLYQGTSVQNAANYDRFGMVIEKHYMDEATETQIVRNRAGISEKEAKKLVGFASDIRKQFEAKKISDTISTRALVYIAQIGMRRGNMRLGIKLCYANKLNQVDRAVIDGVAQRIYG